MSKIFLVIFIVIAIGGVGFALYTQQQTAMNGEKNESQDFWRKLTGQGQNSATTTITDNATSTSGQTATTTAEITNFEQCVAAGKEVVGEKPSRKCVASPDLAYVEIESCSAPTGEKINIYEAQKIFDTSTCALEGSAKDTYVCNEGTGTWWIDIQAYREGCNPACVIDVATKKAEVNWRCTGALIPK